MPLILTQEQQDEQLQDIVRDTLDNFSLAWRLLDVLIKYGAANLPPPRAIVHLCGQGPSVDIPGTNCGFFVVPVVQMAILDCRRSLEFFGLTCDHKMKRLKPIKKRHYSNDLGIENFGLPWIKPNQLINTTALVVSAPVEPILVRVHRWGNKKLAHFTTAQPVVTYQSIRDASKIMTEAYLRLLFDALNRPRPNINPSPT
jgi:hypothetical protein